MSNEKYDTLDHLNSKITQWHHDKGIVSGATDETQCNKMLEEMIELFCACHPDLPPDTLLSLFIMNVNALANEGNFKTVSKENSLAEKIDAIGDMDVVGVNILERNGVSKLTCLNSVYDIISKRQGKVINGSFVKE